MKKYLIFSILLFFYTKSYTQEKTIDKILDNTKGVLDLLNNKKKSDTQKQIISRESSVDSTKSNGLGKFLITNSTQKRVAVSLTLISTTKEYNKQFVLSNGDKETFKNLLPGVYEYVVKFEDGSIAKSGEFEITVENKFVVKEIK